MNPNIGNKIKQLREEHQLSLAELAANASIYPMQLEKIESGEIQPTMAIMVRISRALGTRLGTILDGDLYRLVSPYDTNHSSVMYVDKAKSKSVLFVYDIHPRFEEKTFPVKLQGLDPNKKYKVQEINLMPGQKSTLVTDGGTFSGDFLMKIGMNVFSTAHVHSKVIELTEAH